MGKVLLAIVFLVIGLVAGGIGGSVFGFGGGAGIGIATGLSAGACGVVSAAQEEGLLSSDEVDRVFNRALDDLRQFSEDGGSEREGIVGGAAECDTLLERLRTAAAR